MEQRKTRYQRLQVKNIWLRTVIELFCIICAIVLCSTMIVSSYEQSYADVMRQSTRDNAEQLVHSICSVVERDSIEVEDGQRREYIAERYSDILNSCFIGEDMLYSGAVYTVSGSDCELFAASDGYYTTLKENSLASGEKYKSSKKLDKSLKAAAQGEESTFQAGDVYIAMSPVTSVQGAEPYAVVVASVEYRASMEYPSVVRKRITLISVVCGLMILVYYIASAAVSERKKNKGEAVTRV